MSDTKGWEERFTETLRRLAAPPDPDRATLAELRRCLARDLGRTLSRVGRLFNRVPDYALEEAALVAALFASHQGHEQGVRLGDAFRELRDRAGSGSVEKRLVALLDSEREDLPGRLRQAVSLLGAHKVALDWGQLLTDLRRWDQPSRLVQRDWARRFWQERRAGTPSAGAVPGSQPAA
jgi:CRISPR type I-E-associated protein CasB/Cse2